MYFQFQFSVLFSFEAQKHFFRSFQLFANDYIHNGVSTLINDVKLGAEKNKVVSTFANVASINVEKNNVDQALFNVVNFNIDDPLGRDVIST